MAQPTCNYVICARENFWVLDKFHLMAFRLLQMAYMLMQCD